MKIYPFIICPISSCHGSRRVKRLFDFTTFLPACELACQYSLYSCGGTLPNRVRTERIIVTSHCHGGKISGSQQSALTLDRDGRKKRMGYCFVPECNTAQESHTCQVFSFFFLPYLQGYFCCWDPQILLPPTTPPPHHHHTHPTCSCLYTPFTQDLISKCIFSKMSPLHLLLYKRWEICLF